MKLKKWLYIGMVVTLSAGLAACGGGNDQTDNSDSDQTAKSNGKEELADKQEFTYIETAEMPTADPSLSTDIVSSVMLNNCYEGLYKVGEKNKIEPAGAESLAEVSEDGKTYTFKLREDAKWSNDDPVTAHDYVFSWQRTLDPTTKSEYAYLLEPIANAADIAAGTKDRSELGAKALNDYELEITLEKPCPYFDYLMAFSNFVPQNQKVVEKYGAQYALTSENAVYNGPFIFADFNGPGSDTDWSFKKNEKYYDSKAVKLDKININVVKDSSTALNLFQDGQADDVTLNGELAQQMADDSQMVKELKGATFYLEMNQREADSKYHNANLRHALSYAINRDSLVNNILSNGSITAKGLVPKDVAYNPETDEDFAKEANSNATYDKKKAKEYWEKAKEELKMDKLDIELLADDTENGKKTVEYLQSQLQENLPGVKVVANNVPFSVRLDRSLKGDFNVVIGGWNADYPDPSSFLDLFLTGNTYNRGGFSDADYDKLVNAAANEHALDPIARWDDMLKAEKRVISESYLIPLYQKAEPHMRSEKLKGVIIHPTGARYSYKTAYMIK